ncbi:AFF1 isoform 1 [Pan troglodytes]|uniref:AF4/FMR2 family, member 1 n=2 Tax=Pan troglodytes TaxID=9598 RepID=K7AL91_PANTR|nr:AF4/FMR2 family member 1 isoform X3 [Pan troglodytes]XP_016807328.1 AF4/FMR2 family member 1 isoform X3 [Pan troglodytes]XP_016807329.1 AF4/FMR2 family member 1 isoform X3 [Pan troglodytes]XP_054539785.1 AF4/FMR2 family member 1 isoform X3 [Pan troglodytes]PNI41442.1 AFF1 isoform 1 [Pan troglodytes]
MAFTERVNSSGNSLYNDDRNLLRIREKERRNQEAHQEKEAFPEKIPLFGEPYKTAKGDELSSRIQNMLGNYEEVKEFLSTKSHTHRLDASENRLGKPKYPLIPDKGSSIPSSSFHTSVHHQSIHTPASGPLSVGNISHNPKMAQPRTEPMPSLHAKSCGPPDSQHLTQDRLGQEGFGSSHHKKGDRRADGDHCASVTDSAPGRELSPLISSLPSPVPPLSPIHSNQQTLPRMQGSSKVHGSSNNSKGYCPAKSPKDLAVKVHDKETPQDSLVAPAQPPSQTFPPPSLPSKSVAVQQKPTAYVRPMDGQDQAPSESPELKPLPEDYRQQTFEKTDLKVPAKAKLTKLKMPSQSVEQTYSNEVHCVEEILKEMTHSWPPPLTAIHTPSTAEPSKFPFPTKDSQHVSSVTENQKQYDTSSKTHSNSQQGTSSMLEDDLQLSDSEDSDSEQTPEKPPSSSAPPSAPQSLPEPVASAHSSSAESESTSDSDSSSDSESESSSSDSEENEPLETPAPEPEPPTTNKWQLDNWLTKVSQPAAPPEGPGSTEPPRRHPESKGSSDSATSQEHSESKDPPPKSSSKAPRALPEAPHPGKRSCQKSPAQQEPPQRQTVGTKQPKKPAKASARAGSRTSLQGEREPGLLPYGSRDQTSKDKPKVKTKGRPRAAASNEPKPAVPPSSEKKKHKSSLPAPSKALSGPEPAKDNVEDRSPEHFALVPLTESQGPPHSGSGSRTSGCRQAVVVQEDSRKDRLPLPLRDTKLLSPLRDTPPPQSLMVKITLDLLSRIPQPPGKGSRQRKAEDKQLPAGKKHSSEKRSSDSSSKLAKKRKGEAERDCDNKKIRLEKEIKSQSSSSSSHKESSKTKPSRPSSQSSKKEMLPPPPVSSSSQKPAKPALKRSRREADTCGQDPPKSASSTKSNHKDSSTPKQRRVEGKGSRSSSEHKGSSGDTANPFPVPSLPNGNSKPGKPQVKFDKQQADLHMREAKKMKQKAELMTDKVGKAFKYLEAVLSFIECGIATESESQASKSAYSVYSETVDLIKFIMSLKSFSDATAPTQEKIFAVLCMRCQSILNMAMFRCKKDIAIKYSRTLNKHFESSSKVAQAPSPCIARSTGTPSPLSPMPSPASSVGSQSSAGSVGSSGVAATISTPVTIQNMTSSYVTITSHVLTAFDLWEQAEALTRKNKEFFARLSTNVCTLALNSSLVDLVHYTRQGFQQLQELTKTP